MVALCNSGKNNLWVQRANIQNSLWQPHTPPIKAKPGGGDQWVPAQQSVIVCLPWAAGQEFSPGQKFSGDVKFCWSTRILQGVMCTCLTAILQNLLQFICSFLLVFFFPNRVTSCSHERGCVTISYIYIRWVQCSPVRADCVFCTLVRKRLLS